MTKYIDADRLKAELDKDYQRYRNRYMETRTQYTQGLIDAFDLTEQVIDTLQQEQQEVDLKEETKIWVNLMVGVSFPEQDGDFISEEDYRSVIRQTALHFYELGKNSK